MIFCFVIAKRLLYVFNKDVKTKKIHDTNKNIKKVISIENMISSGDPFTTFLVPRTVYFMLI